MGVATASLVGDIPIPSPYNQRAMATGVLAASIGAQTTTLPRKPRPWLIRAGAQRPSRLIVAFAFLALAPLLIFAYFSVDIASRTVTSAAQARLSGLSGIGG